MDRFPSIRSVAIRGSFMASLLWLIEHDAPTWRVRGTAKALLAKVILSLPVNTDSRALVEIHTAFRY
jgi:hypothetical protein